MAPKRERILSIVAHEIQHAIQDYEGFSAGGGPHTMSRRETSNEDYNRTLGEAEAREVQQSHGQERGMARQAHPKMGRRAERPPAHQPA